MKLIGTGERYDDPTYTNIVAIISRAARGTMRVHPMKASPEGRFPSVIKYAGRTYCIDQERAFMLKGWDAVRPKDWYSTFFDNLPLRRIGLLIFRESEKPSEEWIMPLDRVAGQQLLLSQTPFLLRVFVRSRLYERFVRKMSFGTGVNSKFIIVMLVILIAIILVMWFGGYYG